MAFFLFALVLLLTYLRPVETFIPELAESRIVLITSVIAVLAGLFSQLANKQKVFDRVHVTLLTLFMLFIFASQATRGWLGGAIDAILEFSVNAVFFLLVCWNVNSFKRLRITAALLVFSAIVLAGASVLAFHTGFMADRLISRQSKASDDSLISDAMLAILSPTDDFNDVWLWRIKSLGFLSDPNDFAQFLIVAVVLCVAFFNRKKLLSSTLLLTPLISILLYAIYLTQSRGALVGLGAFIFILGVKRFGIGKMTALFTPFVLVALQYSIVAGRGFSASEESAGGRIVAWSEGLTMLKQYPIFGVGYNSFLDHHNYTAHNAFVLCFAELGLLGYFAWLGLIVFIFLQLKAAAELSKNSLSPTDQRWINSVQIVIAVFLVCSLFLSRTYSPTLYILLALGAVAARFGGVIPNVRPTTGVGGTFSLSHWMRISLITLFSTILLVMGIVRVYWLTAGGP